MIGQIAQPFTIGVFACFLVLIAARSQADDGGVFQRLDANNDGFITANEVDGDKLRLFKRLLRTSDKNEDGKLSRDEF